MNTLRDIREQVIKSFITKELIADSIYPSLDLVCDILFRDYSNLDLGGTLLKDRHYINQGETASLTKMNEIMKLTDLDLETLYRFIEYMDLYLDRSVNSSIHKIKSLAVIAKELEAEAKSLLLMNNDAGYSIEIMEERFQNTDQIDTAMTDAVVDLGGHYASAKPDNGSSWIRFSNEPEITIAALTRNFIYFQPAANFGLERLYDGSEIPWVHEVIMPSSYSGPVEISLKVRFNGKLDFSRLRLKFDNQSTYEVAVNALVENSYVLLSDYKAYTETADITFGKVSSGYVVINIRTSQNRLVSDPKKGRYYKFSCQELELGNQVFAESSVVETKELQASKDITVIGVYSEEDIPSGCDINFELSWKNSDSWSPYVAVTPLNRGLENGQIDSKRSIAVLDNLALLKIPAAIDFTKRHPYLYGTNMATNIHMDSIESIDRIHPGLLRNIGGFTVISKESSLASAVLFITSGSVNFDFSNYPAIINGVQQTKTSTLGAGTYEISINTNNDLSRYKIYLDKLMADNASSFYYGSHMAKYQSPDMFVNLSEDNAYDKFTFAEIDGVYTAVIKILGPEVISGQGKWEDENMLFTYNDITGSLPQILKLRATLKAKDTKTPVLKGFKIKLG